MAPKRRSPDERFDEKWIPEPNTGCHLWAGGCYDTGYGAFWDGDRTVGAHQWAYVRKYGPVGPGLHLDHFVCDTPACCNPDHVRPVTPYENTMRGDGVGARNARKTHCPKGHEYTEGNTQVVKKTGHRQCRECKRIKAYEKYIQDNPSSQRRGPYRTKRSQKSL